MGLFAPRPEEPTEWPGLPGEPLRPESAAERLPDPPLDDIGLVGLLGEGVAVESIVIPVAPDAATPRDQPEDPAGDDDAD